MQPSLEEDWAAIGRPRRRVIERAPTQLSPVDPAEDWAETFDEGGRSAFYTVLGESPQDRHEFYRRFQGGEVGVLSLTRNPRDWLERGPLLTLQEVVEQAWVPEGAKDFLPSWWPPPTATWGLLWALGASPDFIIEEPLRGMVDMRCSLAHDLYRAIWEIRFSIRERGDLLETARLVSAVGTWLLGRPLDGPDIALLEPVGIQRKVTSEQERIDTLLILLTMAAQNGLISRLFTVFDNVERADRAMLKELLLVLQGCNRWARVPGMPLGILLGWNGDGAGLGKANAKLAALILRGVA